MSTMQVIEIALTPTVGAKLHILAESNEEAMKYAMQEC
jgi:hypothetical protein